MASKPVGQGCVAKTSRPPGDTLWGLGGVVSGFLKSPGPGNFSSPVLVGMRQGLFPWLPWQRGQEWKALGKFWRPLPLKFFLPEMPSHPTHCWRPCQVGLRARCLLRPPFLSRSPRSHHSGLSLTLKALRAVACSSYAWNVLPGPGSWALRSEL